MDNKKPNPLVRITWYGALANVLLSATKIFAGYFSGSIAVVADGFHSLSDLISDVIVILGIMAAERPADADHPYGHGKFETLAAMGVSLMLVGVGLGLIWKSGESLSLPHTREIGKIAFVVTIVSLLTKEALFWITRRIALRANSSAGLANAWHHRTDSLSSVAVLAGLAMNAWGWKYGDHIAGIIVGAMVVFAGGRILHDAIRQLTDASVDSKFYDVLSNILKKEKEVDSWHAYKGRRVGREIYLECHVLVDPKMTVQKSHDLTEHIEDHLNEQLKDYPVNLLVHIEPYHFSQEAGRQVRT
ncbi:MAG: cation diffusion facilitator family transporter [Candidatus Sumerlaeia bacterium]